MRVGDAVLYTGAHPGELPPQEGVIIDDDPPYTIRLRATNIELQTDASRLRWQVGEPRPEEAELVEEPIAVGAGIAAHHAAQAAAAQLTVDEFYKYIKRHPMTNYDDVILYFEKASPNTTLHEHATSHQRTSSSYRQQNLPHFNKAASMIRRLHPKSRWRYKKFLELVELQNQIPPEWTVGRDTDNKILFSNDVKGIVAQKITDIPPSTTEEIAQRGRRVI